MFIKRFGLVFCLTLTALLISCAPTPAPASNCFTQNSTAKITTSTTDGSTVDIYNGTCGVTDSGNIPWTDATQLGIKVYPISGLPPVPTYNNILSAVDVKPDGIKFTNSDLTLQPRLSYDLKEHEPKLAPENCSGYDASKGITPQCYEIYQLIGTNWEWVGSAYAEKVGGEWSAKGNVRHFSVFALVELPPPQALPGVGKAPAVLNTVVASAFIRDRYDYTTVSMDITSDPAKSLVKEHLFRFAHLTELVISDSAPKNCTQSNADDRLTCLFPKGTSVTITIGPGGSPIDITMADKSYSANFHAIASEVY